jgi:hypothetical protein
MMGIGPIELLILIVVLLGAFLIPVGTLIVSFLIYDKVKRIEQRLEKG